MYAYPPNWLIVAALLAFALPASAIFGLAAAKVFEKVYDWWAKRTA